MRGTMLTLLAALVVAAAHAAPFDERWRGDIPQQAEPRAKPVEQHAPRAHPRRRVEHQRSKPTSNKPRKLAIDHGFGARHGAARTENYHRPDNPHHLYSRCAY